MIRTKDAYIQIWVRREAPNVGKKDGKKLSLVELAGEPVAAVAVAVAVAASVAVDTMAPIAAVDVGLTLTGRST